MKECKACSGTGRQFVGFSLTGKDCPVCNGEGGIGALFESDTLTGRAEHDDHEAGAYGDPRRCPRHPGEVTSSPDGMVDAPCGLCEGQWDAEEWEYNQENPHRHHCGLRDSLVAAWNMRRAATCQDVADPNEIAF